MSSEKVPTIDNGLKSYCCQNTQMLKESLKEGWKGSLKHILNNTMSYELVSKHEIRNEHVRQLVGGSRGKPIARVQRP